MKQAIFEPIWDVFTLPPVSEGAGINFTAPLRIRALINLEPGETQIAIADDDAEHLTAARKDGVAVSFTITDGVLAVPPSARPTLIELEREGDVTFSIFTGQLIPGLSIDAQGHLKGIVGNIPSFTTRTYRFGLRARYGDLIADVIMSWDAIPAHGSITWNPATLPAFTLDFTKVTGRPFYTMGEFKRGQTVEIGIDISNPDTTPVKVEHRSVPQMILANNHFSALPLGLSISNNPFVISGFIPAETKPGDYFVELFVDEPAAPTPIILHFPVAGDRFDKFTAINRLTWITESNLGTVREGHPSHFKVAAKNGADNVTYALAPGSRQLPLGLRLAPNGELQGIAPHVEADTTFEFTVKASSGLYVNTRTFRFKLLKTFAETKHLTVTLPLSGDHRLAWESYSDQIPSERRFRPTDPQFGTAVPRVMLLRGLKARPIQSLTYDEPIETIVGPFKVAQVMENGEPVYDVIYREFFDPMHKAGGFVPGKEDVIPSAVYRPQDASKQITEGTIRNLRFDLVDRVGLASPAIRARKLGANGGELLDSWMSDYVAAGVVAYVKAGKGAELARTMTYGDIPVGTQIRFERMTVHDGLATYFYYLGWDSNDPEDIVIGAPQGPLDYRVDGVVAEQATQIFIEPTLTWTRRDLDVTYSLRFYAGSTLVRTEDEITGTVFRYSTILQAVDDNPSHVRVELRAHRGNLVSEPLVANILIRAGWGQAWGYRYGGAS